MRNVVVSGFFLCNRYSAHAYYTVSREVAQKLAHGHICTHTIKNDPRWPTGNKRVFCRVRRFYSCGDREALKGEECEGG